MITPKIITFVYWLMLLGVLIGGLGMISRGGPGVMSGIGLIVGGALGARIWCELLIVLFKIHENLRTIATSKVGADTPVA